MLELGPARARARSAEEPAEEPRRRPRIALAAVWAPALVALVAAGAGVLALYWSFLVPIYQSPDEIVLTDYVFGMYRAGHLITVRDGPDGIGHPWTAYLALRTGAERIAFHDDVKAPPDYGSSAYFRQLDRDAPALDRPPDQIPFLVSRYPFAYYAIEALWLVPVGLLFGVRPVELFFGARALNPVLLALSLALTYGVLRELRVRRTTALGLVAATGFFPMVTFVSGYTQPDNLGFTLVAAGLYLGLRARRRLRADGGIAWPVLGGLGLALGLLAVNKYQFWLCALLPVLAMLAAESWTRRRPWRPWAFWAPALLAPSLVLLAVQYWIGHGSRYPLVLHHRAAGFWSDQGVRDAWHAGPVAFAGHVFADLGLFLQNYFTPDGDTFRSFWGTFGWMDTPLVIRSVAVNGLVQHVIQALTILLLGLALVRLEQVTTRLVRIARRGRRRWALRLALANPALNATFLFGAFMVGFFVYTDNTFFAQGRNWLPFVPFLFLAAFEYAPRALTSRWLASRAGGALLVLLLAYSAVGSAYALGDVRSRYYGTGRSVAHVDVKSLAPADAARFAFHVDRVDAGAHTDFQLVPSESGRPAETSSIALVGWAADLAARRPAGGVLIEIDGERDFPAVVGDPRPDVAAAYGPEYRDAGWDAVVPVQDLPPGRHTARLRILSADRRSAVLLPNTIEFER